MKNLITVFLAALSLQNISLVHASGQSREVDLTYKSQDQRDKGRLAHLNSSAAHQERPRCLVRMRTERSKARIQFNPHH
jgi:hypothetical protein